jgi:hypothetical protein
MALIKCYECEKEISDKAPACPHCGAPKEGRPPELEEAEILEGVAVVDEPEPITQETVSAPSTEPEPVATKDEGFNKVVAIAVGALVFQIARSWGMNSGINFIDTSDVYLIGFLTVIYLAIPYALLVRYGKKRSPQVYAGIIGALVVVFGIAIAAGPGDVFIPPQSGSQRDARWAHAPVNVRSGRSTSDPIATGLERGERVEVDSLVDGWFRVFRNGQPIGYSASSVLNEGSLPSPIAQGVDTRQVSPSPSVSCADITGRSQLEDVRSCAEQGDAIAQVNLGFMYANGEGVPEDDVEAVRWYRLATEQGLAEAQFYLGLMYDNGRGVPEDDVEAVRWYRLAAEQGVVEGQTALGLMYASGEGVPHDNAEAERWWRLAAEQGEAVAQEILEGLEGRQQQEDTRGLYPWESEITDEARALQEITGGQGGGDVFGDIIVSKFDGLAYGNRYKLLNGQVWEQIEAWTWVWVWVNPKVLIWNDGGVYKMKVENIDHAVAVIRR